MWTPSELGHGSQLTIADDDPTVSWSLDLRACGEPPAVALVIAADALRLTLRLQNRDQQPLPTVAESYVRGEDFVAVMPQTAASRFALTLQVRLLEANRRRAIAELLIALQTDLLDCHPSLELWSPPAAMLELPDGGDAASTGRSTRAAGSGAAPADDRSQGPGQAARLHLPGTTAGHAAVLFAAGDGPVQTDTDAQQGSCFHLFGEFLEKGVIRKVRPWIGLWRGGPPDEEELAELLQQLRQSPLPLTT